MSTRVAAASRCRVIALLLGILATAGPAWGSSYLLYLEIQGIAGYSFARDRAVFSSMTPEEMMQKPSIGFDFVRRFAGDYGDVAQAALQARLAYNAEHGGETGLKPLEVQVYNAFIKYKAGWADLWAGHNRPALGLGSYLDSHALLLRTLAMQSFGFDRDWGLGLYRDTRWGNWAATLTAGSGAPVRFRGNWMGAGRVSYGVLNMDNWNIGLSAAAGRTLETMGNRVLDGEPADTVLGAVDITSLRDQFEHRFEADAGKVRDEDAWAVFYRFGWVLDGEARWKAEAQPQYIALGSEEDFGFSLCLSHLATADLTVRIAYDYDGREEDHRVLLQFYFYKQVP